MVKKIEIYKDRIGKAKTEGNVGKCRTKKAEQGWKGMEKECMRKKEGVILIERKG